MRTPIESCQTGECQHALQQRSLLNLLKRVGVPTVITPGLAAAASRLAARGYLFEQRVRIGLTGERRYYSLSEATQRWLERQEADAQGQEQGTGGGATLKTIHSRIARNIEAIYDLERENEELLNREKALLTLYHQLQRSTTSHD